MTPSCTFIRPLERSLGNQPATVGGVLDLLAGASTDAGPALGKRSASTASAKTPQQLVRDCSDSEDQNCEYGKLRGKIDRAEQEIRQ